MFFPKHIVGLFSLFLMFITPALCDAQLTEIDIKLSGNYFWGEGFGEQRETAVNNAKRDLIERMIVRIQSDATLNESATNDAHSTEFESNTISKSRLELRGLNYLDPIQKPNGTWEVLAYVSKADFERTMLLEGERLLTALDQALINELAGKLATALPQLLDIYASTFFYPVPFYTEMERHGSRTELRAYLSGKLNTWLNSTRVIQKGTRSLSTSRNVELYIDLNFKYLNNPVDHFSIRIKKTGYAPQVIRNGMVSVFSDLAPESLTKDFVFEIAFITPNNFDDDKKEILLEKLPIRELAIPIDFSEVIFINFDVEEVNENEFTFIPEVQNLNVFSLNWLFEGRENSTETSPTYQFSSLENSPLITLQVNDNENLQIKKRIHADGRLIDADVSSTPPLISSVTNETNSVEEQMTFTVPFRFTSYVNNAVRLKKAEQFDGYLQRLTREGVVNYGNKTMMKDPDNAYIAIVTSDRQQIVTILSPSVNGNRFKLSTNEIIKDTDLRIVFKGLGSLWFEFK